MKPIEPALRTRRIRYAIRDIVVLADRLRREGKKILSLNIGDPCIFGFQPPSELIEAVHEAMKANHNGYGPALGVPEALDALAKEGVRKGIRELRSIYITTGASEAIEVCLTALLDPGENVLLPAPGYPLYSAIMGKLDCPLNFYHLDEEKGWAPDIDDLASRINSRTRGIVLINPNNPTGALYDVETLKAILEIAREKNLVVFSDEIYDQLVFDGNTHVATASLADDIPMVTFGGLSKNFVTPGWRIGWGMLSGPPEIVRDYDQAIQKILRARLCANHPEQYAIPVALNRGRRHIPAMIDALQKRRDVTVEKLNAMEGASCVKPGGAFYAFPSIDIPGSDRDFCEELLRETGVLTVFGEGFGQKPGSKHLRVVFLPPEEILTDAFEKMDAFLQKFRKRHPAAS